MRIFLIVLLCAFIGELYAQDTLVRTKIYLRNGDALYGTMARGDIKHKKVCLHVEDKRNYVKNKKIDSLRLGSELYYYNDLFTSDILTHDLSRGKVNLYELSNSSLVLQRGEDIAYSIPKRKYRKAFGIFCTDVGLNKKPYWTPSRFVQQVRTFNNSEQNVQNVIYDSLIRSHSNLIVRFSIFRPEVGFEIGIASWLSTFHSIGLNFAGNSVRETKYYVNYDYTGELRFFYLNQVRLRNGKSIYNYSGPFLAPRFSYLIERDGENIPIVGMVHGWQSSAFLSRAFLSYRIGLGINPNQEVLILSALALGWTI